MPLMPSILRHSVKYWLPTLDLIIMKTPIVYMPLNLQAKRSSSV